MSAQGRWGGCLWSFLNKPKKSSYIPPNQPLMWPRTVSIWLQLHLHPSTTSICTTAITFAVGPWPPFFLRQRRETNAATGNGSFGQVEAHLGQKRTLWSSVFSPSGSVTRRTRPQKTHINVTKIDKRDCKDGKDSRLRLCKWNEGEELENSKKSTLECY